MSQLFMSLSKGSISVYYSNKLTVTWQKADLWPHQSTW